MDNFIDDGTLSEVIRVCNFIDQEDYWYKAGQASVFHISKILTEWDNKKYYSMMLGILKDIKQECMDVFDTEKNICPDSYMFAKWNPGTKQYPHSDSHLNNGEANDTPWRKFSTVLYLNENFDGGETYFPQHGITIEPKKGRLALFSSGLDYQHGVSEIKNGTRFNLISFWGYEMNRCREYRI